MDNKQTEEPDMVREIMLTTMETMLEIQLQAVRTMIKDLGHQPKVIIRKGRRKNSLLSLSLDVLRAGEKPMHVTQILDELRQRFGRIVGRDSLSSVLGKAVKDGLVRKSARATFEIIEAQGEG
jgi:hypothetical protein